MCVCGNDLMSVVDCLTVNQKRREKVRVLVRERPFESKR